jgi:hypothetical protein
VPRSPNASYQQHRAVIPAHPGGPLVGSFHQIACKFNAKWVGILWSRQAKGAGGRPLWPP